MRQLFAALLILASACIVAAGFVGRARAMRAGGPYLRWSSPSPPALHLPEAKAEAASHERKRPRSDTSCPPSMVENQLNGQGGEGEPE